jgi:DNA-binding GntR family transcriptional regulator
VARTTARTPARAWTMLGLGVAAQAAGTLVVTAPALLIPHLHAQGLSRLEREGLILHEGRSWTVTPIDLDEIASLAELRGVLEPAAARLAVARAQPDALDAVRAHLDALRPTPDQQAGIRMGSTFHLDLAALGGNRFVTDAVADALTRLERTRWIEVRTPEARDAAWQEHSDILEAVRSGDADRAAALVAAHVAGTNDRLLGFIAQERRRLRGAGMAIVGDPERLTTGSGSETGAQGRRA